MISTLVTHTAWYPHVLHTQLDIHTCYTHSLISTHVTHTAWYPHMLHTKLDTTHVTHTAWHPHMLHTQLDIHTCYTHSLISTNVTHTAWYPHMLHTQLDSLLLFMCRCTMEVWMPRTQTPRHPSMLSRDQLWVFTPQSTVTPHVAMSVTNTCNVDHLFGYRDVKKSMIHSKTIRHLGLRSGA